MLSVGNRSHASDCRVEASLSSLELSKIVGILRLILLCFAKQNFAQNDRVYAVMTRYTRPEYGAVYAVRMWWGGNQVWSRPGKFEAAD